MTRARLVILAGPGRQFVMQGDFLNNSTQNQQYQANGTAANAAQSQLLGLTPITDSTQNGYNNYLNSTGYNFNLQQGTNAIASQGAASGLLNSGGTAKGLEAYGQNLGSQYFNNYLNQLGGVSAAGQQAIFAPANAAAATGGAAAQAQSNAGDASASGFNALAGIGNSIVTDPSVSGTWHW